MLAVDGTEPADLRKIMRVSLDSMTEDEERLPAVFESAGGFSPTIGILGAVLGLIQVMQHLDNIAGGWARHCGGLCGDDLRSGHCQSFLSAVCGQDADPHPERASAAGDDAGGRDFDSRGDESAHAGDQADRLCGRRKRVEEGAGRVNARVPRSRVTHDRWLVSYADFITLLFGLFVVMYAFARADQKKQAQVSKAIDSRLSFDGRALVGEKPGRTRRRERRRAAQAR